MSSEDFNWHKVWNLSINGYEFGKDKIMEDKFWETKKKNGSLLLSSFMISVYFSADWTLGRQ